MAWHSFDNTIGALMLDARVTGFVWEPFQGLMLRGCGRAEFLLQVHPCIYDAFFNSPVGYRAQYALGPALGRSKNRELLDALKTKLIANTPESYLAQVVSSIESVEAKIWIYEDEVQNHYFDESPEIDYAPWNNGSDGGVGLRAPVGTQLIVCGGWLDEHGHERVDPHKRRRSEEIHEAGFT
jgi:hypothetical protein